MRANASLSKVVGQLEGRMHGVESGVGELKTTLVKLDEKLDEVIVQIAVARAKNSRERKRHGRIMAIVSGVGTAAAAFLLKLKGGG